LFPSFIPLNVEHLAQVSACAFCSIVVGTMEKKQKGSAMNEKKIESLVVALEDTIQYWYELCSGERYYEESVAIGDIVYGEMLA